MPMRSLQAQAPTTVTETTASQGHTEHSSRSVDGLPPENNRWNPSFPNPTSFHARAHLTTQTILHKLING